MNRTLSGSLNRLAFFCPGGSSVRPRLQRWRGVEIGTNVWFGLYVYIDDLHLTELETRLGLQIDFDDLSPDDLTVIGPLSRYIADRCLVAPPGNHDNQ